MAPLLQVENLSVEFPTRRNTVIAVHDVSFSVEAGKVLGIVGESGAGKSMTGAAIIGLLEPPGRISGGRVLFNGKRIDRLTPAEMRTIRGRYIGAIFQDPLTSLDPLQTVGNQLVETIEAHLSLGRKAARERALALMRDVGIPAAEIRFNQYPHQFSGGMRQRVVIALALAACPRLIIADEPTTALDVSIQAQIIALLKRLCKEHNVAVILITHDIGVIAEIADDVAVMYSGRVVEIGPVGQIIEAPRHPYTVGLMASIPRLDKRQPRLHQIDGSMPRPDRLPSGCTFHPRCQFAFEKCRSERPELTPRGNTRAACWLPGDIAPSISACKRSLAKRLVMNDDTRNEAQISPNDVLISANDLSYHFDVSPSLLTRLLTGASKRVLKAVDKVTLEIRRGETFALVGESGCGKSTLARVIARLYAPTSGRLEMRGVGGTELRTQMIFQDPYASLNPRWRVEDIIAEPMRAGGGAVSRARIRERVGELLELVKLSPEDARKYPHEFSGGQRQRISIARALAGNAEFIVCDEPTSALDVSVQAQILNLMKDLQAQLGLTYLFISHNLAVVRHVADRIGVMYLGKLVESADADAFFEAPIHPYSRLLLDSVPRLTGVGSRRGSAVGEIPNPMEPPAGCAFHPRCVFANDRCRAEQPKQAPRPGGWIMCHAWEEGRLMCKTTTNDSPLVFGSEMRRVP